MSSRHGSPYRLVQSHAVSSSSNGVAVSAMFFGRPIGSSRISRTGLSSAATRVGWVLPHPRHSCRIICSPLRRVMRPRGRMSEAQSLRRSPGCFRSTCRECRQFGQWFRCRPPLGGAPINWRHLPQRNTWSRSLRGGRRSGLRRRVRSRGGRARLRSRSSCSRSSATRSSQSLAMEWCETNGASSAPAAAGARGQSLDRDGCPRRAEGRRGGSHKGCGMCHGSPQVTCSRPEGDALESGHRKSPVMPVHAMPCWTVPVHVPEMCVRESLDVVELVGSSSV